MKYGGAQKILEQHVKGLSLWMHSLAVAEIMETVAMELKEDKEQWKVAGLLHDLDMEITNNGSEHGMKATEILKDKGIPEEVLRSIELHTNRTPPGIRKSKIEIALAACDHVAGLVIFSVIKSPSRKVKDLTVQQISLLLEEGNIPYNIDRNVIREIDKISLSLSVFLGIAIAALSKIAEQLRL